MRPPKQSYSLKICLQLLMLLGRLLCNRSVMQHCLLESTFPNFTAVAGSPFYFNILRHTMKHRRDLQISLTNGKHLPSWVVYTHHSGYLVGLALAEDSGIHHLQISVISHNCTADFYVHVLNATVDSVQRDISVWGSLLLEVDSVSLNATQRIHLVNTVSAFFQLQRESISLISNTNVLPHKTICQPINLKDKNFERDATAGKITQLVWPLRCRSHTQLSFLPDKFETSILAKQLHVPVFAWRFLCNNKAAQKVKRDLKDQLLSQNVTSRESFNVPTLPVQPTSRIDIKQGFIMSTQNTLGETNGKILNNLQSNSIAKAPSLSYGRSELVMSTLLSFEQSITPLILTASSTVMHGITDLQRLPTSLTLGQDLEATAIWTHMYGYSHSESSVRAHMKSQDFLEFRPDFSSPSVSETFVVSFNTDKSSQSSKAILLTWTYSPSSRYLGQTSMTEQYGQSVPPTVSGDSHQEISPLNLISDASLATLASQTAQNELESSMHFSFTIESTASIHTPPLPSGYITSGQSWAYSNNVPFTVRGESISQTFSTEFMGSQLEPELAFGSGLCFDQVHCPAISSTADDWQMLSSTFQGTQPMTTVSQQIYSMLFQSSFINLLSESNHVSLHVSLHGSSAHAYLSTTPASTATASPSVTYSDQISTNDFSPTISNYLGTTTPSSVRQIVSSATNHFPEMSNALYATALLTRWQFDATQGVLSATYEIVPNTSIGNMSLATMVGQMTENELESESLLLFSNRGPDESIFTSSFTYEHSTRLQWTLENISPTLIVQSVLQEMSHVARQSDLSLETQVKADRSEVICYGQNGLSDCSTFLVTTEPEFQTLLSAFEGSQSISATGMIEENEQSSFIRPSFTDVSNVRTYEPFTAIDPQYEVSSSVYFSNTLFATIIPIEKYFSDYLASESYGTASYTEEMAPSTVHSLSTEGTVYLFESLEPSFPLCPSMEFSLCASTVGGIFPETTVDSFIEGNMNNYRTSSFGDSVHWTSEVGSGGQSSSTIWQRASVIVAFSAFNSKGSSLETYVTVLASSSTQSPNYSSATLQKPPDTWTPSYMTSLSVFSLTYTLSPLGSSALMGDCDTDSRSLLKCQSSAQATVGPAKQSTSFKLYSVVSTALLVSIGHSSLNRPSPSSVPVTSSVNCPPKVLQTIPALTATVGFPFLYSISQNTFVDPEDGAAHALSLKMTLIDPPPPSVGSWLSLDRLELHGVPLEIDTHYAPQRVLLSARDKGGLTTSIPFTIDLYRDPIQPCHVFTLTARLSLHSLLLHRQKVELFLTKISNYFNATNYRHLAIVAIAPGSTVVSWYNRSLCDNGQCHYEEINGMWLAMGFENGVVNSKFRHVMLPEFPVVNVEPVSYREDCVSFTQTPPTSTHTTISEQDTTSNISTLNPIITTSKEAASYDKMAAMFIALLVICSLILMVFIIAAILYFCQKRPRVVAIFPSSRMLSVRSRDLSTLRPRPALLLHPEIPPPLPRLWISLEQEDDPQPPEIHERNDSEPQRLPMKYKFSNI